VHAMNPARTRRDRDRGSRSALTRRAACASLVDAARLMNIPADVAIRQYMDLGRRPASSAAR